MKTKMLLTSAVIFMLILMGSNAQTCASGQYYDTGTSDCKMCPAGSSCTGTTTQTTCNSGQYALAGSSSCTTCDAGFSCATKTDLPKRCVPGKYSDAGATSCQDCQAGFSCINGVKQACSTTGYYTSTTGQQYCAACPADSSCTSSTITSCSTQYSDPLSTSCAALTGSFYAAAGQIKRTCPNGFFLDSGYTTCSPCSAGKKCTGVVNEVACSSGEVSDVTMSACLSVAGNMITTNTYLVSGVKVCDAGKYRASVTACTACAANSFCPDPSTSTTTACSAGTFSAASSMHCLQCTPGYYCTGTAKTAVSAGSYSSNFQSQAACTSGKVCPYAWVEDDCQKGYYASSSTVCTQCPDGSSCTTSAATACSNGQYSVGGFTACTSATAGFSVATSHLYSTLNYCGTNQYAAAGATSCTPCASGSFCFWSGSTASCPSSFYCAASSTWPQICTMGHACTSTVDTTCGSFAQSAPLLGSSCQAKAALADAFYYSGNTIYIISVPAGKTFQATATSNELDCTNAGYCTYGLQKTCPSTWSVMLMTPPTANWYCKQCTYGKACYPATTESPNCMNNTRFSSAGNLDCFMCPLDKDCSFRNQFFEYRDNANDMLSCPIGKFANYSDLVCSDIYSINNFCRFGYYSVTNAADVSLRAALQRITCTEYGFTRTSTPAGISCTYGSYGLSTFPYCLVSPPGYIMKGANADTYNTADACPQGFYCGIDFDHTTSTYSLRTTRCPYGTYARTSYTAGKTEQDTCLVCPNGKYCKGDSKATSCDNGYICDRGTVRQTVICPLGFYFDAAATEYTIYGKCVQCPADFYCPATSVSVTKVACPGGYRCGIQTNDPKGYATKPGYFLASNPGTETICGTGKYCPAASTAEQTCPAGYFQSGTGFAGMEDCEVCGLGKVCTSTGAISAGSTSCSAGSFCPEATQAERFCPPGTYRSSTGGNKEDDCSECVAGVSCPIQSTVNTGACAAGHYCLIHTYDPKETPCPDGTMTASTSLTSKASCTACSATGSYCLEGATAITPCEKGYKCLGSGALKVACGAGKYSVPGTDTCPDCPQGSICPLGYQEINPISCPKGYFMGTLGSSGPCTPCTEGYKCDTAGTITPTACGSGMWSTAGQQICEQCPAGYYCGASTKTACGVGYYCPLGASTQTACGAGYYCPALSTFQRKCPPGMYSAGTATSCSITTAGFFTKEGQSDTTMTSNSNKCAAGYYCDAGAKGSIHKPCPAGYFSDVGANGVGQCNQCTAGFYCVAGTSSVTITSSPCPLGNFCPLGSAVPTKCAKGSYRGTTGAAAQTDCTQCDAGKVCSQDGLTSPDLTCDAGYYCKQGAPTSQPTDPLIGGYCSEGNFCIQGSANQVSCPAGKFNVFKGCRSASECLDCPFGFICDGTTGINNLCPAGKYCPGGTTTATAQDPLAGYHTIAGQGAQIPCIPGTFTGVISQSTCGACTAGKYCSGSATATPTDCTAGKYCPAGTIQAFYCPQGTFRLSVGAAALGECTPCTGGKYCATIGLTAVTGDCAAGFYCTEGAFHPKPAYGSTDAGAIFGPCKVGKYCLAGATTETDCGIGKYSPSKANSAATDCQSCIPGSWCSAASLAAPEGKCNIGYYCPAGSTSATANGCTAGYYCPLGSDQMLKCPAGQYQDTPNQGVCKPCTQGKYCTSASATDGTACPNGYYCPASTGDYKKYPCAPGTFSSAGSLIASTGCTTCTAGKYCTKYGLTAETGGCAAGYFCLAGARSSTPPFIAEGRMCTAGEICPAGSSAAVDCPATFVCNAEGLAAATIKCNNGFICGAKLMWKNPETLGAVGDYCPAGKWCQAGVSTDCANKFFLPSKGAGATSGITECLNCPYGYYCATAGLGAPTAQCQAGYYCLLSQDLDTTNACTAGFYCGLGSIQQTPCGPGNYQDAGTQSTCKPCTSTNFCLYSSTLGTPAQTTCPKGSKCNAGSLDRPTLCSSGYYQDQLGQTTCASCTGGNFCDRYGMEAQSTCPAGYYCTAGQLIEKLNICNPGFYCPAGSTTPTSCPAGKYCADYGLSTPSGDCYAGYFCLGGAKTPNPTDTTTGDICPQGYYCPDGNLKTACVIGKYNELLGAETIAACLDCIAGKTCATPGLPYPTSDCPAGKYCPLSLPQKDCDIGYKCPAGTVDQILCLPGTYQDVAGQSICIDCPAGSYCNYNGAGITVKLDCPAGYYCPAKTEDYLSYPCDSGTFNPSLNLQASASCTQCTANSYCMSKGLSAVTGTCTNGYTCPAGTKIPASNLLLCPRNFYCVAGVQTECTLSTYTYSGSSTALGATSSSDCMKCLPGKVCANHDTGITSCPAGSTCIDSVATTCTTGHYCPTGSFIALACGRGTYSSSTGASTCQTCPDVKYCNLLSTVTPTDCPATSICVPGSVKPLPCTYGTYASSNTCSNCPAGKWCWKTDGNNNKGDCNDGFICSSASISPTPFYPGIVTSASANLNTYNGRAARGCYTVSTLASKTTVNTLCPTGTYMPSMGSSACNPCPRGFYCDVTGIYDISTKICKEGYVCMANSVSDSPIDGSTGKICPVNYYCPAGTGKEIQCEEGKMALLTGKPVCDPCNDGYSCTTTTPHAACASGNTRCILGTGVEPLCPSSTYLSGAACISCPAGLYCVDGKSNPAPADCSHGQCCTAGFLCSGGSASPKPTGTGGNACDAGYYCPEGATSKQTCPADLYIFTTGARQVSDCTPCMEGYICTQGNPLPQPCPAGKYCPTGITGWLACPVGTYSSQLRNKIVHDCTSCPAGFLCNATVVSPFGIPDYNTTTYYCPQGGYCYERSNANIKCPYGTYNDLTGSKSVAECKQCPAGYFCNQTGQINGTFFSCTGGQNCPVGTAFPAVCPQGYYCSNVTGYLPKTCPVNFYCPPNTTFPIACVAGESCPEGSKFPLKCVSGQISILINTVLTCQTCPAGTYSISGLSTACKPCTPGHVCLGATNAQLPWSTKYHNGYKCPAGAYCPEGSSSPIYCPTGTYNPYEGLYDSTACLLCKANTFNPSQGQAACLPCGDSATSDQGWSSCSCKGKNRAFLISDSSCRCKPGFEYLEGGAIQNDVNSKIDCQPIIYKRCSEAEIRAYDGSCKGKNDCSDACDGGEGTRSPTLGICECKTVQRLDKECNKACRDALPTMTISSDGQIRINKADDLYNYNPTYLSPLNLTGFNSEYMTCTSGKACSTKGIQFTGTGTVSANYGLPPRLGTAYAGLTSGKRLLEDKRLLASVSSTGITNPVICIHEGDSTIFEVDGNGHYPIYQKDSLLNSNPDFDYGPFKILSERVAAQMANGINTPQYFGYTFTKSGRYFFTDSVNTEKTLVVSVTKASEKCPNEGAFLQPRTGGSLSVFGLALNDSIMLEPDYIMLIIILFVFVGSLFMLMVLMRWVTDHMWKAKDTADPMFREKHKEFDVKSIKYLASGADKSATPLANAPFNQFGIFKDKDNEDQGLDSLFVSELADGLNLQKLEELDPFIIEKILKDYQAYKDYLQKELLGACERQSKQIEDLNSAIEKLKFLLNERYEKLIALLKLDVDYTKLTNVKIKMVEEKEEVKKQSKRTKPSDIKLAKSDEKKAADVLKQIAARKNEANLSDVYQENKDTGDDDSNKGGEKGDAQPSDTAEEKIKKGFEERLIMMKGLNDFEKNKLRDELATELINLEYVLAGEKEEQEIAIRRMIQMRKKKGKDTSKSQEQINLNDLTPEEREIKNKIEIQIEDEARDREREIEQRTLAKIQKSKERLLKHLGAPAGISEKEKEIILNNHKNDLEVLLETIKLEKDKQLEDLHKRLEKRKLAKVNEEIHALREEKGASLPVEESSEPAIEIPQESNEAIAALAAEEASRQAELEKIHQEEAKQLMEGNAIEIKEKEDNLIEDLELEVEKEIESKKEKIEEKFRFRQQDIEDQRRKLKDQLLCSGDNKEVSQKLMEDVKEKDNKLKDLLEQEKKENDCLLEERINRRKITKQKKLLAFQNAQNDKAIELKLKQLKEKQDMQGKYETEKIKEIIKQARATEGTSPEANTKLYKMFEQLWNDKEAMELANMFGRQLAEKENKLRAIYKKNIEQKLMEKQGVKDKYKMLYEDLENRRAKIGSDEADAQYRQLKVEEENDLKEMDIKESMNQKKEEFALRQEMEEKSASDLSQLQDTLAQEKLGAMKDLFGNQREEEIALGKRIRDMKEIIEREKDRKIKDIELDKKIILEKHENELKERFSNFEDIIKKQREVEKLIKEKKGNIERMIEERKKQMAEFKDKAQFKPEQERQLLEKHRQELKSLEAAMEAERNRQFALMREKLESKQGRRERETSYHKKKVAFLMGTVGKNVTLGIADKAMEMTKPKTELEKSIYKWKKEMEDREKSQKTTTFETLQKYLENVGKFKEKGLEGIYLQGTQYQKYLQLMKASKILQKKLEELHRIKANGALLDLKAALKIFAEDDFDRLKARPERIGGGYRCFDNEGNILWELYKFLHT